MVGLDIVGVVAGAAQKLNAQPSDGWTALEAPRDLAPAPTILDVANGITRTPVGVVVDAIFMQAPAAATSELQTFTASEAITPEIQGFAPESINSHGIVTYQLDDHVGAASEVTKVPVILNELSYPPEFVAIAERMRGSAPTSTWLDFSSAATTNVLAQTAGAVFAEPERRNSTTADQDWFAAVAA